MAGNDASEFRYGARFHVSSQQQVQHGHEVRLARAKRAVEVAGRAATGLDAAAYKSEGFVEGAFELGGDNICPDRLRSRRLAYALRQLQDEIVRLDPVRDMDQVTK